MNESLTETECPYKSWAIYEAYTTPINNEGIHCSQFGYLDIVWILVWMFHSRKINSRINRLHERVIS